MTPEELRAALIVDDWKVETDGYQWRNTGLDWWAWKVFEGAVDCMGNDKPPHVALIPWSYADRQSVQFEICGEVQGQQWIKLEAYSTPMDEALARLPHAKAVLIAAWNAAASIEDRR